MTTYEKLSEPFITAFPDEWYSYTGDNHFWFAWRLQALKHLLSENNLRANASRLGLDIGGGMAFFRSQVESMTDWTIDVTDLNAFALEHAIPGRGRTLLYNIEDRKPEFKGRYNVLFLFDVLEHVEDPGRFLEAALWHLAPGGALIINVPALPILYSRYDQLVGHYVRYRRTSLRRLLESSAARLKIVDFRYWGLSLIPVAGLRKLIVASCKTPDQAVANGFKVSAQWINRLFHTLMKIETGLLRHPPAGTSLMVLAIKSRN